MVLVMAAAFAVVKSWAAPIPRVWTASNGAYAMSMVPPTEKVKESRLRLFTVDGEDRERTLWRARLPYVPCRVEVSEDGHAAAIGQAPQQTEGDAVVIYGDDGRVLGRHEVRSLLTPEEFALAPRDPFGGMRWFRNAYWPSIRNQLNAPKELSLPPTVRNVGEMRGIRNEFPVAFAVVLENGREIWFDLVTGKAYPLPKV